MIIGDTFVFKLVHKVDFYMISDALFLRILAYLLHDDSNQLKELSGSLEGIFRIISM